jgi:hypothetical protein
MASGYSISCPGRSPSTTRGTSARPVASDVIRIGASRSLAARSTRSTPNVSPSSCSRCWAWLISRMPLRAAMPNTVKNPTRDPIERIPPVAKAASTPPTSAMGSVTKARRAGRQLPSATCRSRKMIASEMAPIVNSRVWAACCSSNSPSSSTW